VDVLFTTARDAAYETVNEATAGVTRQVCELEKRSQLLNASLDQVRKAVESIDATAVQSKDCVRDLSEALRRVQAIRKEFESLDEDIQDTTNEIARVAAFKAVEEASQGISRRVSEISGHCTKFEQSLELVRKAAATIEATESKSRDSLAAFNQAINSATSLAKEFGTFGTSMRSISMEVGKMINAQEQALNQTRHAIEEHIGRSMTELRKDAEARQHQTETRTIGWIIGVGIVVSLVAVFL
jgi:prefoldin subunit 5